MQDPFNEVFERPIDIEVRYRADVDEVAYILTDEEEAELVARARQGDEEARESILLTCLFFVMSVATKYFRTLATRRNDWLDLVGVGNLALVEMLDLALTKDKPFPYLMIRARYAIQTYCYYYSDLVTRIRGYDLPEPVISLQEEIDLVVPDENPAVYDGGEVLNKELYNALKSLTPLQREMIVRRYGLFGKPEEARADIYPISGSRHTTAIHKLRKLLGVE